MAKKSKQPYDDIDELEVEKEPNKFQWFLFVIIIPLIFAILVIAIVLSLTGGNVFEKAKEISDTVSTQIFDKEQKKSTDDYEKEIVNLEADIKDKEAEIKSLGGIVDSRDQTIQQLEAEKQQLQMQLDDIQNQQNTDQNINQNTQNASQNLGQGTTNNMNEVVKTYETMSPKKSAPILAEMSDSDAVEILAKLKTDIVAKVLEQMTPQDAARLTNKLKKQQQN